MKDENRKDFVKWQEEFYSGPAVWATYYDGEFGEIYESREAAQIAVDWHRARWTKAEMTKIYIHSLKLAQERWVSERRK